MLACCSNNSVVSNVLTQVLEHDNAFVHFLHPNNGGAGQQDAAATSAQAHAAGAQAVSHGQQQGQQESHATVLLAELLRIAVESRSAEGVQVLCNVPSAHSLGEFGMLRCASFARLQCKRSSGVFEQPARSQQMTQITLG